MSKTPPQSVQLYLHSANSQKVSSRTKTQQTSQSINCKYIYMCFYLFKCWQQAWSRTMSMCGAICFDRLGRVDREDGKEQQQCRVPGPNVLHTRPRRICKEQKSLFTLWTRDFLGWKLHYHRTAASLSHRMSVKKIKGQKQTNSADYLSVHVGVFLQASTSTCL